MTDVPSPVFACEVVPERRAVRLQLRGEVDLATAPLVDALLGELVDAGFAQVIVDLAGVEFLDSGGIALLMRWAERAPARGCALRVTRGQPAVMRVLEIAGLTAALEWE